VLASCTFLTAPGLNELLRASQHGKEEEPDQRAIRPELWAPESSFQEQSEAQGCPDGSSDTEVPVDGSGQLRSHRTCSPWGHF